MLTVRPSGALSAAERAETGDEGARLLAFLARGRDHDVRLGA